MARIERENYELNEYEKYIYERSNIDGLILNQSKCRVRINHNIVHLLIDPFFAIQYEKEKALNPEEDFLCEDIDDEDEDEENTTDICKKFQVRFWDAKENGQENECCEHENYANQFSGSTITYPLGEGLLDFFYFDIQDNILPFLLMSAGFPKGKTPEESIKVKNSKEYQAYIFKQWIRTNECCDMFFYSSLYTAAFTPVFLDKDQNIFKHYLNYVVELQKEFQEKIEFCFDPDFYPSVLGHLYPSERYQLYCTIYKTRSLAFNRTEEFSVRQGGLIKGDMPFGYSQELILKRLRMNIDKDSSEYQEFNEKYCHNQLHEDSLRIPSHIQIEYVCTNLFDMLNLEFTKMLESNIKIKKCKRCGRYFIMKGNYDTNYCDRIIEGQTRTCQELAAQEHYKAKVAGNPALPIYSRYYKRYAARVRSHQLKEADFKKWKYQALSKRDACSNGEITPEQYTEWMEDYFPNRKPKA